MAAKKASGKPVDRTQIYVALIGVIGTVVVALITVYANKSAGSVPTPTTTAGISITASADASTNSTSTPQNRGVCLEDYFAKVTADNRLDLEAGISTRISAKKDAVYGVRFLDGGKLLGELQFTAAANTKSFKVVSVMDGGCSQVFDYGNLDRPDAKSALNNWENLGLSLPDGKYRMRAAAPSLLA